MISCSDLRCKWCDNYKCIRKDVDLTLQGVQTVHQGMQYLLKCDSFDEDEQYKKIREMLEDIKNVSYEELGGSNE